MHNNMKTISAVYQIKNIINGHRYIGSSVDVYSRFACHKSDLKNGKHCNSHLQRAWNKYGEDAFEFSTILLCTKDDTLLNEQKYLDEMKPEYNMAICAEASARGIIRSEEHRAKMSAANMGRVVTEETRAKLREAMKGRAPWNQGKHHSEETKEKISEAHKGKRPSDETCAKMSKSGMGRKVTEETKQKISMATKGENHHMYGKHPTNEAKAKMSEAHINNKSALGHIVTDEAKAKLRTANLGKKHTDETRAKMCASQKLRRTNEGLLEVLWRKYCTV
jgi:group I intron endonuclease